MSVTVFIDGAAGTTGLQIKERLEGSGDIALLRLDDAERKDTARRREMLNAADFVILCLPDDSAREAVGLIENSRTRVIDASTAHRTADGWAYGFPEYEPGQRALIAQSKRVANPGCYALTSIAILHPLIKADILKPDWPVAINAISGYSGGGKGLIAAFEDASSASYTQAPFYAYGLTLAHKHLPEITTWAGLSHAPVFVPSVGRFAQGMIVQVPLALWAMAGNPTPGDVHSALAAHYEGQRFVTVAPLEESAAMTQLQPEALNGTNQLALYVFANKENGQAVVMGLIDNLGKGASGQAAQNLNVMMGVPEETGLG